jgi:hypothetical protein
MKNRAWERMAAKGGAGVCQPAARGPAVEHLRRLAPPHRYRPTPEVSLALRQGKEIKPCHAKNYCGGPASPGWSAE